jgi:hypothetical protein
LRLREFRERDDLMYLRAIYVMQVIGKRRTWDRMVFWDFTYLSQTIWSLAIFVSFDGLRQGFRSVSGSTAVCRCIYSNEKINRMRAI